MNTVTVLGILVIIAFASIYFFTTKAAVVEGTVVSKNICRANFDSSYVTIETSSGLHVEIEFDTTSNLRHEHHGDQCFHSMGEELDAIIKKGTRIKVRTKGGNGAIQYVYKLISPTMR